MADNALKPSDGHYCSGNYGNVPVTQDATETPVTSPQTAAATLTVPPYAVALNVIINSASTLSTVQPRKGTTNQGGAVELPAGVIARFECAGMNGRPNQTAADKEYPDNFLITPGTDGRISFWFDCTTPDGA